MSVHLAKPEHEVAYQDMVELVRKHAGTLTAMEMLAVGANMLGKLVALQDQRVMTPALALKIVAANLERGNQQIVEQLAGNTGGTS